MRKIRAVHIVTLVLAAALVLHVMAGRLSLSGTETPASSQATSEKPLPADSQTEDEAEFEAYQKRLEDGDMENLMQMASTADGAYADAAFYELTARLFHDPDTALTGIVRSAYLNDVMGQTEEEKAFSFYVIGRYNVADYADKLENEGGGEQSQALRSALEAIGEDDERYFAASNILAGWEHPENEEALRAAASKARG